MKILVTGCAGLIGAKVTQLLLKSHHEVIGIDNLNDYYDTNLKHCRLKEFSEHPDFYFYKNDIADLKALARVVEDHEPTHIIHLAAQAGVRYSLECPEAYVQANLVGFANILELARQTKIKHLIFASSSSVYGNPSESPFCETANILQPQSFYAATKIANEAMAYSYSQLYQIPMTALRYFTVYGPYGRPDMAPFKFAEKILKGEPIEIYNYGHHRRDFTFVDDAAHATLKIFEAPKFSNLNVPFEIYNIGYGEPIELLKFIELLETALGKQAIKEFLSEQPGDVKETWANTAKLQRDHQFKPETHLEDGIKIFADWFKDFYKN